MGELQTRIGYSFKKVSLLEVALTHRSAALVGHRENNERLEFLGDAVLSLAVSDLLMRRFPRSDEGELSRWRASLVNTRRLASRARELELGGWLNLGKGEERSGGRNKDSILAAACEALIGAIYLDRGYGAAKRFVLEHFLTDVRKPAPEAEKDYKTQLQELTQRMFRTTPTYKLIDASGPEHAKHFLSEISVGGRKLATGAGKSKKGAEQDAAREALAALENCGSSTLRVQPEGAGARESQWERRR